MYDSFGRKGIMTKIDLQLRQVKSQVVLDKEKGETGVERMRKGKREM